MTRMKLILPLLVLGVGFAVAVLIVIARPEAKPQVRHSPVPLVRVVRVERRDFSLLVSTQGSVYPAAEIELVPEVAGRVVYVSEDMTTGGFFEENQVLLRIDPRDYELAVKSAQASVAQARVALAREEAEAEVARGEWESLRGGVAPSLVLREPQLAEARAAVAAAEAQRERAELDLERSVIRAPFRGRVRRENVDKGQFLSRGVPVASLYSVDFAEVRLPLPDDQLAYLNLPLGYRGPGEKEAGPRVELSAMFAGKRYTWQGRIVRTEGELDPASRMVHAIARVRDPYARGNDPDRPPLAVGMFVEAEIQGRRVTGGFSIPRIAMRGSGKVMVVDDEGKLRFKNVEVVRSESDRVIVSSGLANGDRVCVSPLEVAVDGMAVRVAEPEAGA